MNLQTLKLKASTLCAGGTLLVFGGFLTVNLAGCGGGGGGGLTTIPTPSPVGATFRIQAQDGSASRGGTVTLTRGGQTFTGSADNNGVAVLNNVPPGTYTVTFTAFGSDGNALPSTTRTLTITNSGAQSYILVQGDTGNGRFTLTGTIFNNPGNSANRNCTATSQPFTGDALISVRDLNDTTGSPIVAQITRPAQFGVASNLEGRYTISIPALTGQRTFRVEVGPAGNNGTQLAGISSTTTLTVPTTGGSLGGVDVCANQSRVIPLPQKTPTPTVTPTLNAFPIGTVTPAPTVDPNATAVPTITPVPASTTVPTSTTVPGTTFGTGGTTGAIGTPVPGTTNSPVGTAVPPTSATPVSGLTTTPIPLTSARKRR